VSDTTTMKKTELYPRESALQVLGAICNDTQKLRKSQLQQKDFNDEFHKIVFTAINDIVYGGGNPRQVAPSDVDTYIAGYPKQFEKWQKYGGVEFLYTVIENSNADNFEFNYKRVKKQSLLRDYQYHGIDITQIYPSMDTDTDIVKHQEKMKKFDAMEINEIVDFFQAKFTKLRSEWTITKDSKNFKAGEGIRGLLNRMNEEPVYGEPFNNGYFNTLFRGKNKGKFLLRSGGTGTGKTFSSLIDACDLGCSHIYDYGVKDWKQRPNRAKPTLLISTEIDKDELQINMLAYISGVAVSVIKNGKYSADITQRLATAINVLEKAPIFVVYIPDFSIEDIENIIEEHILDFGVEYVYFDYIQITPKLARTMASNFGMNLREDQILVNFAQALKTIAEKFDVFMCSSTQLNRNHKDTDNRDATCLRGGLVKLASTLKKLGELLNEGVTKFFSC